MSPERLPIASVRARGTDMQDQLELGGAPGQGLPLCAFLSDLPEQAGGVSLRQVSKDIGAPGRQSGDAEERARRRSALPPPDREARISGVSCEGLSTSTTRGPEPGEHSGAWGEFEVFQESSASSEQFCQSFELQERPAASQPRRTASAQKERGSSQPHQGGVTETSATATPEPVISCDRVLRSAFQEVPVPQAAEGIASLDHFLETRDGENSGLESTHKLCSESRRLWRALHNTGDTATSRCIWNESHSRENFLPVLGVDAAQKLSGTPAGGQGSLITYSLFLKTPVHGNGQYITTPRKKIFSPRNLKLTLFNSDIC
ncbi:uncharacterized protein CLBA1 isoform X2 [Ovis aries]|uniref:uncharacterized protein CLBA1 isoform X2 n=1 Tax=Ovis aries TaxID=9940 RepID=UPI0005FAFF59|nr:uncharacterized protein CLBA1 isoform X2 [Ovis aries]XP_042091563.1 uncharacterized protein CLBA1 isoform X2 [Ovis aries]